MVATGRGLGGREEAVHLRALIPGTSRVPHARQWGAGSGLMCFLDCARLGVAAAKEDEERTVEAGADAAVPVAVAEAKSEASSIRSAIRCADVDGEVAAQRRAAAERK